MAMWSMMKQKLIYQLSCKIFEMTRSKWPTDRFYVCEICHELSLCKTLHFVLYSWSSYFAFFFSYVYILKLLKFKMAALRPFWRCFLTKLIRSLADIAEHTYQIQRRSDGNFFLKRANEHFFVSGRSKSRVDDMGIKMSTKQLPSGMWLLCEVWGSRRLVAILKTNSCGGGGGGGPFGL